VELHTKEWQVRAVQAGQADNKCLPRLETILTVRSEKNKNQTKETKQKKPWKKSLEKEKSRRTKKINIVQKK
jgi:hypothetical protein